MAKELTTAVMVRERSLDWTTLAEGKGTQQTADTRHSTLTFGGNETATLFNTKDEDRATAAQEIRATCGKLGGFVAVGVPSSRVLMRVVELPNAPASELQSMVELQLDKISPFPAENMTVSHELLAVKDGTARVLMAAIQSDSVNGLRKTFLAAGVTVRRVDVDLLGWWRLLSDGGHVKTAGRQVILIRDGPDCDLIVAQQGAPLICRSLGSIGTLSEDDFAAEIARDVAYTLTSLEVEYGAGALAPVNLWHRGDAPEMLKSRIEEECGGHVEMHPLDPLPPLTEGLARRAAAHDAAVLDLAPTAWRMAERAAAMRRKMILVSVAIAAIWLLGVGGVFGVLQWHKQELGTLQKNLASLETKAEEVRQTRNRVKTLDQYTERKYSGLESLLEITKVQPQGLTTTSFIYRKAKTVSLSGEAASVNLVYAFKQALDKSELFRGVRLEGPSQQKGKEVFKMTADLPGGGTP